MSQSQTLQMSGPPYPATTAGIGGVPTTTVDVPATAVFLALYIAFAATNMTIFQKNRRRQHKFIMSGAMFGFCMARVGTCVMRIAWATRPTNVQLAIVANILVNAGILIIYVINIIFASRILRAKRPQIGWNKVLRTIMKVPYVFIGLSLVGVIVSAVLSLYTLDTYIRQVCRDIQLAAITYLFVFTTIPFFALAAAYLLPKTSPEEHFGEESMKRKTLVLLASTTLCVIISGFKCGTTWEAPRPINQPAWYHSKAAFYVFNFSLEIVILTILTASRVDKLFYVPDGSNGPGDYSENGVVSRKISQNGEAEVEVEKA